MQKYRGMNWRRINGNSGKMTNRISDKRLQYLDKMFSDEEADTEMIQSFINYMLLWHILISCDMCIYCHTVWVYTTSYDFLIVRSLRTQHVLYKQRIQTIFFPFAFFNATIDLIFFFFFFVKSTKFWNITSSILIESRIYVIYSCKYV